MGRGCKVSCTWVRGAPGDGGAGCSVGGNTPKVAGFVVEDAVCGLYFSLSLPSSSTSLAACPRTTNPEPVSLSGRALATPSPAPPAHSACIAPACSTNGTGVHGRSVSVHAGRRRHSIQAVLTAPRGVGRRSPAASSPVSPGWLLLWPLSQT